MKLHRRVVARRASSTLFVKAWHICANICTLIGLRKSLERKGTRRRGFAADAAETEKRHYTRTCKIVSKVVVNGKVEREGREWRIKKERLGRNDVEGVLGCEVLVLWLVKVVEYRRKRSIVDRENSCTSDILYFGYSKEKIRI